MKILIVNSKGINDGAGRAAYRLHKALLNESIDSQFLGQKKDCDDYTVLGPDTKIQKEIARVRAFFDELRIIRHKTKSLFSPSWLPFSNFSNKINKINPDVVHLHWIGMGMIRVEDLLKIKAPIVWSLHDMWPFTGGCHYSGSCDKYKSGCFNCEVLNSQKNNDYSKKLYKRKKETFSSIENITFIGLSKWIENCAKESGLLKGKRVINIPNPINTDVFSAMDKKVARDILNLPQNKKIVLFGAVNSTSDPRKGFDELCKAINNIKNANVEFIVFGSNKPKDFRELKYKTHFLGKLNDNISLKVVYNAADVMVVPSLQENLSNAIMESLACATPVVAFDIGGNSDMIDHMKNGYLAQPFDADDLAQGIDWIFNASYDELSKSARNKVLSEFDSKIVVMKYINLYKSIIKR